MFIVADFEELESLNPKLNVKETFNLRRLANKLMVHIENKEELKKANHPALAVDYNDLKEKEAQNEVNIEEAKQFQEQEKENSKNVNKDQNPFAGGDDNGEINVNTKAGDLKATTNEKDEKVIENKNTTKTKTSERLAV